MASFPFPSSNGSGAEKPAPTANNTAEEVEENQEGIELFSSDSEGLQEQLEVVFNASDGQKSRRRASLAPMTAKPSRPTHSRQKTGCFLHSMLEGRVKQGYFSATSAGVSDKLKRVDKAGGDGKGSGEGEGEGQGEDEGTSTAGGVLTGEEEHRHSRLLTKKQLSDMASGVRDLANKLSRIRVKLNVRNVFILTKAHDPTLIAKTRIMAKWLLSSRGQDGTPYTVWVEDTMRRNKAFDAEDLLEGNPELQQHLRYWTNELCRKRPHTFDVVICLGGDGTVLYCSWLFQRIVPPVLSFALGSLGFLTKFDFDQHENILTRTFQEGVTVSLRLRFEATVMRSQSRQDEDDQRARDLVDELIGDLASDATSHRPDGVHNIMNDIVLDRGPNATMSAIEMFGDDEHFTTVQGDGLCVATPTGSTAYNLAAGGSLCHPQNPVMLVTAIAPHTLSFRPIILPDTTVLRLGVPYDARASCWASFDGKERSELRPGDYVTISASRFPFPTVLPLDRKGEDWVDSISRTLNWNNRQRQKAFVEAKDTNGKEETS